VDTKESVETIKKFLEKYPYSLPILLDKTGKMGRLFGVWAHPTTYIINRKGLVCYRAVGDIAWTSLEATSVIEVLLQEK